MVALLGLSGLFGLAEIDLGGWSCWDPGWKPSFGTRNGQGWAIGLFFLVARKSPGCEPWNQDKKLVWLLFGIVAAQWTSRYIVENDMLKVGRAYSGFRTSWLTTLARFVR